MIGEEFKIGDKVFFYSSHDRKIISGDIIYENAKGGWFVIERGNTRYDKNDIDIDNPIFKDKMKAIRFHMSKIMGVRDLGMLNNSWFSHDEEWAISVCDNLYLQQRER